MTKPKLALGPLQYYWPREDTLAFYEAALDWPVDVVYLGETVCARRHELRQPDWFALADRFAAAGREVVWSSPVLIESESDLKAMRKGIDEAGARGCQVEANEYGAVRRLAEMRLPFVAGATLNIYNPDTLDMLASLGALRWQPPVEMPAQRLAQVARPPGMETEVLVQGRLPLAYSARCFTARHYTLQKDDCQFRCLDHPDGLSLKTREGQAFLTLNGIATQSACVQVLAHRRDELLDLGVGVWRIAPQAHHMVRVLRHWRALIDGAATPQQTLENLLPLLPDEPCDGYWQGAAGLAWRPEQALESAA